MTSNENDIEVINEFLYHMSSVDIHDYLGRLEDASNRELFKRLISLLGDIQIKTF